MVQTEGEKCSKRYVLTRRTTLALTVGLAVVLLWLLAGCRVADQRNRPKTPMVGRWPPPPLTVATSIPRSSGFRLQGAYRWPGSRLRALRLIPPLHLRCRRKHHQVGRCR